MVPIPIFPVAFSMNSRLLPVPSPMLNPELVSLFVVSLGFRLIEQTGVSSSRVW